MVHIRQATLADVAILADLGRQTFLDAFGADNDPTDMAQYLETAFSFDAVQAQVADPNAVVLLAHPAVATEPPVGYAHLIERSAVPDCADHDNAIELSRLYVDSRQVSQGYGSHLMQACIDHATAQGFDTLWLGVWEKNLRAQKFYQRWGFQKVGTQDFFLGKDIQTDYVLIRSVTQA